MGAMKDGAGSSALIPLLAGGLDQRLENLAHLRDRLHGFRVPLNCQAEGMIGHFHPFDDPIRGECSRFEARRQSPDTLVVHTVDLDHGRPQNFRQTRFFGHLNGVGGVITRVFWMPAVAHAVCVLVEDITSETERPAGLGGSCPVRIFPWAMSERIFP